MTDVETIKLEIREAQMPYFTDAEIQYYLNKNSGVVEDAIYELLTIKAEDSTISVSGLTTADTSAYFRKLASRHKKFNSGALQGD